MTRGRTITEPYEKLAKRLISEDPAVDRGTMMGFLCLRRDGLFFTSLEQGSGCLILKLPASRMKKFVADGTGFPFAPNGRVTRVRAATSSTERVKFPVVSPRGSAAFRPERE